MQYKDSPKSYLLGEIILNIDKKNVESVVYIFEIHIRDDLSSVS